MADMAKRTTFTFVIGDAKVKPHDVSWADLAAALATLEHAILATASVDVRRLGRQRPLIALTAIKEGSNALVSEAPPEIMPAVLKIVESLAARRVDDLPYSVQQDLYTLHKRLTPKYREWGFNENTQLRIQHVRVSAKAPIAAPKEPVYLESASTIYGWLYSAGGKRSPSLALDVGGKEIKVEVPQELARDAAARLYRTVGLEGTAYWRPDSLEIEKFRATRVLDYKEADRLEGLNRLADLAAPALVSVNLVKHFSTEDEGDEG